MSAQFVKGTTLKTKLGGTITIDKWLAEGGQGDIYLVDYVGKEKILKWYKSGSLGDDPMLFYNNIEKNIRRGAPSNDFIWPEDITEFNHGQYGYIMDLKPDNYYELGDYMNKVVQFKNYRVMIDAALNMVNAFRLLHNSGLSYQDINEGNFAINPDNGSIKIMDNDNVAPNGEPTGVLGKPRYMAPEIVIGISKRQEALTKGVDKKNLPPFVMPNTQTDLHSMAIILYILFTLNHPLEGRHYLTPGLTAAIQEKLYGTDAAFMMEKNNKGNNPDPLIHKNSLLIWPMLPRYIQELFLKALGQEGLYSPNKRPQEVHWVHALVRFRADITSCACKTEVFTKDGRPCTCQKCGRPLNIKYRLEFPGYSIPGKKGVRIYDCQVKTVKYKDTLNIAGTVVSKPNDPNSLWLLNRSKEAWQVTTPSGKSRRVKPEEALPLKDGLSFEIAGTKILIKEN